MQIADKEKTIVGKRDSGIVTTVEAGTTAKAVTAYELRVTE